MPIPLSPVLRAGLEATLGPRRFTAAPPDLERRLTDWRNRRHGRAAALLFPAAEVTRVVWLCAEEGAPTVPQGGNMSMVGGETPDESGSSPILSLRRMNTSRADCPEDIVMFADAGVIISQPHEAACARSQRYHEPWQAVSRPLDEERE